MKPFLPKRFEPVAFGFLLTCLMTFFVTGISTWLALGLEAEGFARIWLTSWMTTWALAFPVILFVGPLVRRILKTIIKH